MMSARKLIVLAVVVVELVLFAALLSARLGYWNQAGWAGLAFHPWQESLSRDNPLVQLLKIRPGQVFTVAAWSPAYNAGVRIDDVVTSINGVPINDLVGMRRLDRELGAGDRIQYTLLRGDDELTLEVELIRPYRLGSNLFALAESTAVGLAILAISLLVMWGRPRSLPALLFFLMCASGAAIMLGWAAGELNMPNLRGLNPVQATAGFAATYAAVVLISIFVTNVLLHFVLVFPRERPIVSRIKKLGWWLHSIPFLPFLGVIGFILVLKYADDGGAWLAAVTVVLTLIAAGGAATIARAVRTHGLRPGILSCPGATGMLFVALMSAPAILLATSEEADPFIIGIVVGIASVLVALLVMLLYSVLTCIALARSYREAGVEGKRQLRWPLWGTLLSMGASAAVFVFGMIWGFTSSELDASTYVTQYVVIFLSKPLSLLIPASFAAAILKYRLMDIDVIIRKTVVFSFVTAALAIGYLAVSGLLGFTLGQSMGSGNRWISSVTALLFIAAFVPLLRWTQRLVERRLYRRKIDQEQTRARIEHLAATAASFEELLPPLVDELQRGLDCRTVGVFLDRTRKGRLQWEHGLGLPSGRTSGLSLPSTDPVVGDGATVIDRRTAPVGPQLEEVFQAVQGELAVVVRTADEVVGLVTVGRRISGASFEDEDGPFLVAVAGILAEAFERLRGRRARAELTQAQEIQKALLPATIAQIDRLAVAATWRPAREVSGDSYDVIAFDEHRLAVCIGDVVGKGLPAALLMASLQSAVRAVASADTSPRDLCRQVRRVVSQNLTGGKFVTFFYALVDRHAETVTTSCAGHNPAILVRRDGTVQRLQAGGPAAARMLGDLDYDEQCTPFRPGDMLLLFTDGVTEAMDADGALFGDDRLEQLVAQFRTEDPARLVNRIVHATETHARGLLQDDLTIVAVRVLD